MSDPSTPRLGPCQPWCTASDVTAMKYPADLDPDDIEALAPIMATIASEALYADTARQFTGLCGPVTVRPLSRPTDVDTRYGNRGVPSGYLSAGQYGSAWGSGDSSAVNRYGSSGPPTVDLGAYPVIEILEVLIDGILIPPNEYQLRNRRQLVRMLPSAGAAPTQRWGWPVNQRNWLPLTEVGTFGVTYMYGVAPPPDCVLAAKTLAQQLILNELGADNSLPQRVTSVSRQGVSVVVADVEDFLKDGMTGIWVVDWAIQRWNPTKAKNRPQIWSPDLGRPRRVPN